MVIRIRRAAGRSVGVTRWTAEPLMDRPMRKDAMGKWRLSCWCAKGSAPGGLVVT